MPSKNVINNVYEKENIEPLGFVGKYLKNTEGAFGVISSQQANLTEDENKVRRIALKNLVAKMGLGFIDLKGSLRNENSFLEATSLFIPDIPKKQALKLGVQFEQYSILFKDKSEFVEIGTNENAGIGNVLSHFEFDSSDDTLNLVVFKTFFTKLIEGNHTGIHSITRLNEILVSEKIPLSFNEVTYHKKQPDKDEKWIEL